MGNKNSDWKEAGYSEKRNMDDVYIRVKRDGKYDSVCLSDATNWELREWLDKQPAKVLLGTTSHISGRIKTVSDLLGGVVKVEGLRLEALRVVTRRLVQDLSDLALCLDVVCKDGGLMVQEHLPIEGGDSDDNAVSEVRQ